MTVELKLDENLADRHGTALEAADHDVSSVFQQRISGIADTDLYSLCQREERVLVTLDLDFSNVLEFPPDKTAGIVVLRTRSPLLSTIDRLIDNLIQALATNDPKGSLWIVELGRLRIHISNEE